MWLKTDDLKGLGVPKRTYHRKLQSGEWRSRETGRRGRNGKEVREVELDSLPRELQLKWVEQNKPVEPQSEGSLTIECIDSERRLTEALLRYKDPQTREAFRDEAVRLRQIVNDYEKISPKRVKGADGKHEFVAAIQQLCKDVICTNEVVLAIEPKRRSPISPITLDGWWRKSKTLGLAAFLRPAPAPVKPSDNRLASISPAAEEWIENNWKTHPSPRHLHRKLKKIAKKSNWTIPSESWIRRNYGSMPKIVKAIVFGTDKDYQGKFAPFLPRTVEDLEALQILCGDHSIRDVTIVLPDGSLKRPWLTLWLDMRTYLIWGWHLDLIPSSKTIGLAYANGVRTFGAQPLADPENDFCSYLYTDQGKDYRAKEWDGKPLFFKQAARVDGGLQMICSHRQVGFYAETGIQHIMARGYNAKEKPVERVHKDISAWEKNTFLRDGYCGKSPDDKPDEWRYAYQRHKKLQKKFGKNVHTLLEESPFFTLDEYREALVGWIHEHNTTEHQRSVLGGRKIIPVDELERLYSRVEISDEALALLLMKAEKRRIGKNGVNLFRSNWWFLHPEMSEHKGEEIEIRYSDDDYSRVFAILPATKIKPVRIVESVLITPSSIRNPNKRSNELVNFQKRYEKDLVKNFSVLNQSIFRGETVEDRVAAAIEPPPEEVEAKQVAAGGSLRQFTRFDAPKIPANNRSTLSTETINNAKVLDMFPAQKPKKRIKEEWETD